MNHTDIFPSAIISINSEKEITDLIKGKVNHIVKNLSEEIPHCNATSSKNKVSNLLELSKFESLKDHIQFEVISNICKIYNIRNLKLKNSFVIHVPKENGFLQIQKSLDSTFTILLNISKTSEITLANPSTYLQSNSFDSFGPNKYNSQYALFPFEENGSLIIPSSIHYGISKLKEDLTFICTTTQ